MKKLNNLSNDFEYELLNENQQDIGLREKIVTLYATPFCDILWWEARGYSVKNGECYKLYYYERSVLKHIILFKHFVQMPKKIIVLNQEFNIDLRDIENICCILFNEFEKARQVVFINVFQTNHCQPWKVVIEESSNDVIISDLPNSIDDYLKSLSKNTRHNIKSAINHISRDFPDYKIHFLKKDEILFEHIERLLSLNSERMKTKGKIVTPIHIESKKFHQYVSTSGFCFLGVCTIEDKMISGILFAIVGEHAYGFVIAHDNSYNPYSIGLITYFNSIKYTIEKNNTKYFHLLRGSEWYKFRLGGINHYLYNVRVFRNYDVYYFWNKTLNYCNVNYRKFKSRIKNNKIAYNFYTRIKNMEMRKQGV